MKNFIFASVFSIILLWHPDFDPSAFFVQSDLDLMARVVMSEASTQDFDCKHAVAATIINRYNSDRFPNDISEIIEGQYSTSDNGEPTEECYEAVYAALAFPDAFPSDMYYFRSKHFHTFGHDYTRIDDLYFSTREYCYE